LRFTSHLLKEYDDDADDDGLGSAVSFPSGSVRSPAAKCNLVNSGPRNERFLTCQSGKLQCSQNYLIHIFLIQ